MLLSGTALAVPVVLLLGYLGVAILHPSVSSPRSSDALVVLGPSWGWRTDTADRLMSAGAARALVVSAHPDDTLGTPPTPCRDARRRSYPVYCFDPDPATTRGEARAIARLAKQHGWKEIQVLTFRPQITRARLLVERCFPGTVRMLENPESYAAANQFLYQSGAFIKVAVSPGC